MKTLRFLIVFLLVQSIFFSTTANAAVGGWTMSNPIASGASTVYTGIKNITLNGADYVKKGTAMITPPATGVAKVLARGVAGYALSVAVEQLLGAVDWVLDSANNRIIYYPPDSGFIYHDKTSLNSSNVSAYGHVQGCKAVISYLASALNREMKYSSSTPYPNAKCFYTVGSSSTVSSASFYATQVDKEEKYLPLPTVAQQVISNAQSGDAAAQVATGAAAADIVAEAEADQTGVKARPIVQQLENTSTTKPADEAAAEKANEATGEQTKNPDKPDTTDLKLEFPIFCNWAPTVCEAAQVVISFPQTLTNWWETGKTKAEEWVTSISEAWTAAKEWAKSEEPEDTELEIPEPEQPEIDTEIAFGGNCPADYEAQINMGVGTIKMPISYEPICTTVSTAKPVLIFVGFFIAALIIGGVKTE